MNQCPTVNTDLEITWPNPKPEFFLISSELFEELISELSVLRKNRTLIDKHSAQWFYLMAHPEDVKIVVRHMVFGEKLEYDAYGHVITTKRKDNGITDGDSD